MEYLPDIQFSGFRGGARYRNRGINYTTDNVTYDMRRRDGDNPRVVPNGLEPIQIVRDAFQRYIVQTPAASNTIAIRITYLVNATDTIPRTMYIIKRLTNGLQARVNEPSYTYGFPSGEEIEDPGNVFENNQIEELVTQLQGFHSILMVTLCEIYHDRGRYYPFTIPIRVLYRDVPEEWIDMIREQREAQRQQTRQQQAQAQQQQAQALQQQRVEQFANPTDEGAQALLDNPFFAQNPFDDPAANQGDNPDPLQVVNNQAILGMPLNSFVWPGMCMICMDSDPTESGGLCRVGCAVGHIFHCDCINGYRNTRTVYGWNNNCPVCRTEIDQYVQFPANRNSELPTEFGRKRFNEIKYLKSLI
jgi:hypothetical protein